MSLVMFDSKTIDGLIGRSFNGYRVTRFIARDRMGVVFEGIQEPRGQPVAIKLLYCQPRDQLFPERFEREARALTSLKHPNIVRLLDFGSDGPLQYFVMELIDGESLKERLAAVHAAESGFTADLIISIVQQVGSALFYTHRSGYVHGDLNSGNILLANDGRVQKRFSYSILVPRRRDWIPVQMHSMPAVAVATQARSLPDPDKPAPDRARPLRAT